MESRINWFVMANHTHICMVVDDDCLERFAPAVRQLCVGLVDEAIRVTVVGPPTGGTGALELGPVRIQHYESMSRWRRKRSLAELVAKLGKDPPHVIHAMSGGVAWLGAHIAAALDMPLIVTLTGSDELTEMTDPILRSAATIIAVSDSIRAEAIQRLERSEDDVVRIRWSLVSGTEPTCFLDENKIPTLVAISPLVRDVGLEHLIDAMAKLKNGPMPAMLFVLGSGPAESRLRRRANNLGLDELVTFAGPIVEWSSVLEGADVFVLPCEQHKLTIHPTAAMAAGVVVVATEGGDYDCLVDGQTARLYHPPSAELLSAVLAEVLANPDGARQLAAHAQHYAGEHHRASTMVDQTVHRYRELVLSQRTIPMPSPASSESDNI